MDLVIGKRYNDRYWYHVLPLGSQSGPEWEDRIEVSSREELIKIMMDALDEGHVVLTRLKEVRPLTERFYRETTTTYHCPRCDHEGHIEYLGAWGTPQHSCPACGVLGSAITELIRSGGTKQLRESEDGMRGGGSVSTPSRVSARSTGWGGEKLVPRTVSKGPEDAPIVNFRTPGGLDVHSLLM